MSKSYTPTIGIEIHVQLATKTKMFCSCDNDSRTSEPNTNICPVCMAYPGTLPVVNKRAVELAIKLGRGMNAKIATHTSFDRKNYFYPDSPKGYQITQMDEPIIQAGHVDILIDGEFRRIGVHHAHLEEDAGKSTHPDGANYTLVDFNRAGTPLVEIVSEPDMHTPEEARRYLQEVYNIATALGVTHGDLQHGNFKFDLNVSVSPDDSLGTRTELKNLNSFRNAERALVYEIARQIDVLEAGEKIVQETRGYNDAKNTTFSQRGKEQAHDYRYFPEPDLPPLTITPKMIEHAEGEIVTLPIEVRRELVTAGVGVDEQDVLIGQPHTLLTFQQARELLTDKALSPKLVNWLVGDYQALLSAGVKTQLTGEHLAELVEMVARGSISSKIAKDIFADVVGGKRPQAVVAAKGIEQLSDRTELEAIVRTVLEHNPAAVAEYKAGQDKVLGFLVGQVMKQTQGQANPGMINQILRELLA
jgi:aspartyl-tRNA(Asn)/glutamyl-tRNA(Gln) amidotransferase subunit B